MQDVLFISWLYLYFNNYISILIGKNPCEKL